MGRGSPKLKSIEQIFKEKGGYEVFGELSGTEMFGWSYDGPFDEFEAQGHPGGFPAENCRCSGETKVGTGETCA